jgi:transcriptional regulator with XRE-family HTH domain
MTEKSSDASSEADPVLVELGRRLLRARLRFGERMDPPKSISQAHIGREFDVTGVTVGAWEAGKNDPGVPMLYRLADYYGVRRVWLLTGEGDMYDEGGNVIADPPPKPITNPPQIPIITRGKPANLPMAPPRKPGKRNRGDRSAMVG